MLIWLSRQSTSLVRMRSPVRIRVLAPDKKPHCIYLRWGCFNVQKIGSLSSLSIVGVRKTEKLRQRIRIKNPLIIFVPGLCKTVRHKLISCSFELRISYTLLQNYTAARCFCMGATLWHSFLLLGLRECSALLGEDYERCNC